MAEKIEIRCKTKGCNKLLMQYFPSGENKELNLSGVQMKCGKCKRVFHLKSYTEQMLLQTAVNGVFTV